MQRNRQIGAAFRMSRAGESWDDSLFENAGSPWDAEDSEFDSNVYKDLLVKNTQRSQKLTL